VVNLARQLAGDFGSSRINIDALCPGFLVTAMVRPFIEGPSLNKSLDDGASWPRLGSHAGCLRCYALAGPQSDWVTGSTLTVDRGLTVK
jgi:NAD(P)-dependent dehydrogenase (short-subunit alcohol dehydrogenase family)